MIKEMRLLREMLDKEKIDWHDASDYGIDRTHFDYRGYHWSIIYGLGSYGYEEMKLELMSNAVNDGDPIGWLTAKECIEFVRGHRSDENDHD